MKVNMHEAKSQLSRLAKLAWQGEEVIIAKAGEPYLRLEPYRPRRVERKMGGLEGQIWMSPDFDEEDEEIITAPDNLSSVIEEWGFEHLPLTFFHVEQAGLLPMHHRDPFDRLLIAQAQAEGLILVTRGRHIRRYGIRTLAA
ncbi:MAG: hypothetical protein OXC18_20745 [Desulfurellaceae bacterium]|nr:hypothetical protein [Desulfurellaceae bacterium]